MRLSSTGFTHCGGCRDHNEDAFLGMPEKGVWIVADGMGGYQAGDIASQLTCDTVAEHLKRPGTRLTPETLEQALSLANERVRRYGAEALDGQTLGSTVVALLIKEGRYHLFWAGDSRCYRARHSRVSQLSRDHSQVADLIEQGILRASEAEGHPLAHVITRALGVDDCLTLEYRTGEVLEGDIFLLCSDGVSREFSNADLAGFLSTDQIEDASLAIMHSALVKDCKDNISCIIVNVGRRCYNNDMSSEVEDPTVPVELR